jgi:hypothetical protein
MTAEEMKIVAGAIATIIVALGVALPGVISALRVAKLDRKIDANTQVTEAVHTQTEVIASHVNSEATTYKAKIEALTEQVTSLKLQLVVVEDRAKGLARQAAGDLSTSRKVPCE